MKRNEVIDALVARRSIRSFTDQAISHEDLETIVTCGQFAPCAYGHQGWRFVVVEDAEKIASLIETMGIAMGNTDYTMYDPKAIIIVGHVKHEKFSREDDACALQNIFLAAHSLGIGSVWINQMRDIFDDPRVNAELKWLGLSDDYEVHGMAALGYAAQVPAARERTSTIAWA